MHNSTMCAKNKMLFRLWIFVLPAVFADGWSLPTTIPFAGQPAANALACRVSHSLHRQKKYGKRGLSVTNAGSTNADDYTNASGNIFYLQQRFKLKDEWAIKVSESAIGKSIDTLNRTVIVERIVFLRKRLKLSKIELATIIRKAPVLLKCRSDENIGPTIDFLSERLGLRTMAVSKIVQTQPNLLGLKQETLQRKLNYIKSRICLNNTEKVAAIVKKCPGLLALSIDKNLEPTVVKFQKYFGFNDAKVSILFTKAPNLLGLDFDKSIKARIEWFRETLDANVEEISKIVKERPTLLYLSIDSLESNHLWLKKRLKVDEQMLKTMIIRMPAIRSYSTENNMEPTIQWFESEFGPSAKFMMQKSPALLGCNITTNTEPTLSFYKECVGEETAKHMIKAVPAYLTYSLENRLKPRLEEAKEKGMFVDTKLINKLARFTKAQWEAELQNFEKKWELKR